MAANIQYIKKAPRPALFKVLHSKNDDSVVWDLKPTEKL